MATSAYWKTHEKPRAPGDLRAHECVILEREGKPIDEWLFRKGALECTMKMRGRLTLSAAEGLREAVLSGLGIVVVSEWLFSPELASGAVESVLDDWALPMQDLWAVFPAGGLDSAKAREFVAFVERCMAAPYARRAAFILARNEGIPRERLILGAPLGRFSVEPRVAVVTEDRHGQLSVSQPRQPEGARHRRHVRIGRAIAIQLAREGADVIVHGRDAERGAKVVQEIRSADGKARFVGADPRERGGRSPAGGRRWRGRYPDQQRGSRSLRGDRGARGRSVRRPVREQRASSVHPRRGSGPGHGRAREREHRQHRQHGRSARAGWRRGLRSDQGVPLVDDPSLGRGVQWQWRARESGRARAGPHGWRAARP